MSAIRLPSNLSRVRCTVLASVAHFGFGPHGLDDSGRHDDHGDPNRAGRMHALTKCRLFPCRTTLVVLAILAAYAAAPFGLHGASAAPHRPGGEGGRFGLRSRIVCPPYRPPATPTAPSERPAMPSSPEAGELRRAAPEPPPSLADLLEACRKARGQFQPITASSLQRARDRLNASLAELDKRLKVGGPHGDGWRTYLELDQLAELVEDPAAADPDRLDHFYGLLAAGHAGLELDCFAQVRRNLARYITLARAGQYAELEQYYVSLLDQLERQLAWPQQPPDAEDPPLVADIVAQLEDIEQAESLIGLIRRYFAGANVRFCMSARLVGAALDRPIDDTGPVYDVILGTELFGTAHTTGRMTATLIPRGDRAEIRAEWNVAAASRATGYNGPIRVFSAGKTELFAQKTLLLSPEGVRSAPAVSRAKTESTIEGLCAVRGGRLVERFAWRRAAAQKQLGDWIASRHAEERINRRLDDEFRGPLEQLNRAFDQRVRKPLELRGAWFETLRVWSTDGQILGEGFQAGVAKMGAAALPPQPPAEADAVLSIHESLVNGGVADALAGMLLDESRLLQSVERLLGEVPEQLRGEEGQPPWGIALAHVRPVTVRFDDDRVGFTFRGRQYRRGGETYPAMDVTVHYQIEREGAKLTARRVGAVEAFPPDFRPGQSERLSAREQVLRTLLQRRFSKLFAEQWTLQPIDTPHHWPSQGVLVPVGWQADNGWLVLAWRYEPRRGAELREPTALSARQ